MNEQDSELIRKFARFEGVTISDFAHAAILEKIEDSYDLQELREAIAQDSGERFSIDEIWTTSTNDCTAHPIAR